MKMRMLFLLATVFLTFKAYSEFLPTAVSFNFEQTFKSAINGKEKKSIGQMDYMFPGHVRFKVESPDKVEYVSNKDKTWYYTAPFIDGEPGELSVRTNEKPMILGQFFDYLEKGLNDNEIYKVEKIKNGRKLIFSSKAKSDLGLNEVLMTFSGKEEKFSDIENIELFYTDKKRAVIKLNSIKIKQNFEKSHFTFVAPPNTRMTN